MFTVLPVGPDAAAQTEPLHRLERNLASEESRFAFSVSKFYVFTTSLDVKVRTALHPKRATVSFAGDDVVILHNTHMDVLLGPMHRKSEYFRRMRQGIGGAICDADMVRFLDEGEEDDGASSLRKALAIGDLYDCVGWLQEILRLALRTPDDAVIAYEAGDPPGVKVSGREGFASHQVSPDLQRVTFARSLVECGFTDWVDHASDRFDVTNAHDDAPPHREFVHARDSSVFERRFEDAHRAAGVRDLADGLVRDGLVDQNDVGLDDDVRPLPSRFFVN